MKKFKIEIILMGVLAMIFASCSDFFEPNNDTTLNGDRYIKEGRYKLSETKLFI